MFNLPTLITFGVTIFSIYFPTYLTYKVQIKDLMLNDNEENKQKINLRKKSIKTLKKTTITLIITILFLYFIPSIISLFTSNEIGFLLKNIVETIMKILTFRDNHFSNIDFQFSFIIGTILYFIIFIFFSIFISDFRFIAKLILKLLLIWCLIWANFFISSFLVLYIENYFNLISLCLNLVAYALISFFLLYLLSFVPTSPSNNNIEDSETHNNPKCLPSSDELNDSSSQITIELKNEDFEIEEILKSIDSKKLLSSSKDETK